MQNKQINPLTLRCTQQEIDLAGSIATARGESRHYLALEAFRLGLALFASRHGFILPADTSSSDIPKE